MVRIFNPIINDATFYLNSLREAHVQIYFSFFIFLLSRERWLKDYMKKFVNDELLSTMFILFHTLENISLKIATVLRDMINHQILF